jgi:hypothetical protein
MNKRQIPLTLLFLFFAVLPIWMSPTSADKSLAEEIVGRYYLGQNISDSDGRLRESIVIEQEIYTLEDGKESKTTAYLFMKDADTYLVYMKNERNESICYLYRGDRQWVYRENLRNPMRVNMSQNVSGAANLGDLIGIDILQDFDLEEIEEVSGGYDLKYLRGRSSYPYPSIVIESRGENGDISGIEYQGLGGRSMRRVDLLDYKTIAGNHRIPTWRITNLVTDMEDMTEIRYLSIKPIDIPGSYFSPNGNALGHFLKWSEGVLN